MGKRSLLGAVFCAAVVAVAGAGSAFAGEITGPGSPTGGGGGPTAAPEHAQSICSTSGLNHLHPGEDPTRVQSYGQIVAAGGKAFVPSPGEACNGHTGFWAGP
jgi:hypothetical protein